MKKVNVIVRGNYVVMKKSLNASIPLRDHLLKITVLNVVFLVTFKIFSFVSLTFVCSGDIEFQSIMLPMYSIVSLYSYCVN